MNISKYIDSGLLELLDLLEVHVTRFNQTDFELFSPVALPTEANMIAKSMNLQSIPDFVQNNTQVITNNLSYEYVFDISMQEELKNILFKATEKQRYDEFSKIADDEISQELSEE